MRRWRGWLVVAAAGALTGAWALRPLVSPTAARAAAERAFDRARDEVGLARFGRYARRFPDHAVAQGPLPVGNPPRLMLTPRPEGLELLVPPLPPPGGPARVVAGPLWLGPGQLAWLAEPPGRPPALVRLDLTTGRLAAGAPPSARRFRLAFPAVCAILEHPARETILTLDPPLAGAVDARLLALTPDGSWLLLAATAAGGTPELWRCRPDGADAARLCVTGSAVAAVAVSPAGTHLAFFDGPAVAVVGLADTTARVVQRYPVAAVLQPAAPAWSPDGRSLAYGVSDGDAWRTVVCPLEAPDRAIEHPRLHTLETLAFAGPERLLQSQRRIDSEDWLITLRTPADPFHSRILRSRARSAALAADGRALAWIDEAGLGTLLLTTPLADLNVADRPTDKLPERPAGTPEEVSPTPDAGGPPPPDFAT